PGSAGHRASNEPGAGSGRASWRMSGRGALGASAPTVASGRLSDHDFDPNTSAMLGGSDSAGRGGGGDGGVRGDKVTSSDSGTTGGGGSPGRRGPSATGRRSRGMSSSEPSIGGAATRGSGRTSGLSEDFGENSLPGGARRGSSRKSRPGPSAPGLGVKSIPRGVARG